MGVMKCHQAMLRTESASDWTACERLKGRIFGAYLKEEFARAAVAPRDIAALFPSMTGGLTGCVSNWLLGYNCPTSRQYHVIRGYLNGRNCQRDYLQRDYEEWLHREYEALRRPFQVSSAVPHNREYEALRRPFQVSSAVPHTDVWHFAPVPAAPGKHPAEKPLPLLRHMIEVSSRPGDTVLDCCAGSFSALEAAQQCGRKAIGIEQEARWWRYGQSRVSQQDLFVPEGLLSVVPTPAQSHLFAKG